jgi:hypothetical protein
LKGGEEMAKRKVAKRAVKEDSCEMHGNCHCRNVMIRIGAMAFILFLVTAWAGLGRALLSVPWWLYLIIWIIFCGSAMGMRHKCWCCKK